MIKRYKRTVNETDYIHVYRERQNKGNLDVEDMLFLLEGRIITA